jgi:hypothetical protein
MPFHFAKSICVRPQISGSHTAMQLDQQDCGSPEVHRKSRVYFDKAPDVINAQELPQARRIYLATLGSDVCKSHTNQGEDVLCPEPRSQLEKD